MAIVCMIPARMGSERVKGKNLRHLGEHSLLGRAVTLAKAANCFGEVWVNTFGPELESEALRYGAQLHVRPEELTRGDVQNDQYVAEFLRAHECEWVVMLNTTSPCLRAETVRRLTACLVGCDADTVMSASPIQGHFWQGTPAAPAPRNFLLGEMQNTQGLARYWLTAWALTAWRRTVFLRLADSGRCPTFGGRVVLFPIPKDEAIDVDTEEDLTMAENLLRGRGDL